MDKSLLTSPTIDAIQGLRETILDVVNSPAMETIRKNNEMMQSILNNSLTEMVQRNQEMIQSFVNSPAMEVIRLSQEATYNLINNQIYDAIQMHRESMGKLTSSSGFLELQKDLTQLRWKIGHQLETFDTVRVSDVIPEITMDLENLYETLSEQEIEEENQKQAFEFKQSLEELILYIYKLRFTLNTVNTKVIWDFLEKLAILLTIYSSLFGGIDLPKIWDNLKTELEEPAPNIEESPEKEKKPEVDQLIIGGERG
ncbi:hypothetical protein [Cytobacillus pseudoceanisediminis]